VLSNGVSVCHLAPSRRVALEIGPIAGRRHTVDYGAVAGVGEVPGTATKFVPTSLSNR